VPHSRVCWSIMSSALEGRYGEPEESELVRDGWLVNERRFNQDPYTVAFLQFDIYRNEVFCILSSKRMQDVILAEKEAAIKKKIGKKNTGF